MNIWPWSKIRELERQLEAAKEVSETIARGKHWLVIDADNTMVSDIQVMAGRGIYVAGNNTVIQRLVIDMPEGRQITVGSVWAEDTHS